MTRESLRKYLRLTSRRNEPRLKKKNGGEGGGGEGETRARGRERERGKAKGLGRKEEARGQVEESREEERAGEKERTKRTEEPGGVWGEGGREGGRVCGGWKGFAMRGRREEEEEGRARRKSTSEDYGNDIRFFSLSSSVFLSWLRLSFSLSRIFSSLSSPPISACLSSFTFLSLFFTFSLFLLPLPLAENVLE